MTQRTSPFRRPPATEAPPVPPAAAAPHSVPPAANGVAILIPPAPEHAPAPKSNETPPHIAHTRSMLPPAIPRTKTPGGKHDPFWLGHLLVTKGILSEGELNAAIREFRAHPADPFSSALVRLSICSQVEIAKYTAEYHGLPYVEIPHRYIPQALVRKMRQLRALHHIAVPYSEDGHALTIAVADPDKYTETEAARDFRKHTLTFVIAAKSDIEAAVNEAWAPTITATTPKQLLDELVAKAASEGVTDIHFNPMPTDALAIWRRIDGALHYYQGISGRDMKMGLIQAVKTIAGHMDIAETRLPQDGQAKYVSGATSFNLRIATFPTANGEKATIRIQNETRNLLSLSALGLEPDQETTLAERALKRDSLTLVAGPTGSGKTTLLFALLASSVRKDELVVTAEDPIEYSVPAYMQAEVNDRIGRTFPVLLRSFLRHNPNVILLGEMRDQETITIAIRASLTGHRVYSTVHASNAAGIPVRLTEEGITPDLITESVKTVVGTRLVRRLCTCSHPMEGEALEAQIRHYGPGEYREPWGCDLCQGRGFKGLTVLAEVFPLDDPETKNLIRRKAAKEELEKHLARFGPTMREIGLRKARLGITTAFEVVTALTD